jgi:lysophospholipase
MERCLPTPKHLITTDGIKLQELQYMPIAPIAHVLLVLGKNECLLKYNELAENLASFKIAVTVYDHRGQGFSDRILENKDKCHINSFMQYVDDLEFIIKNNSLNIPTFIIAISMGAAITLRFLKEKLLPINLYGVIFISPFLGIKAPIPISILKVLLKLKSFITTKDSYFYRNDTFKPRIFGVNANTHDQKRHDAYFNLYKKYPNARLGGMTNQWLYEVLNNISILTNEKWELPVPTLFIIANNDNIVNSNRSKNFVMKHNQDPFKPKMKIINNSFHDLLLEKDEIQSIAIKTINDFISSLLK